MKVPDRWLQYSEGARIIGTRFVAFKAPLRENYCTTLLPHESFSPSKLLNSFPELKLVIDLTFTTKYYNGEIEFEKRGVEYKKLKCEGHSIPSQDVFEQFVSIVDTFMENHSEDELIGVHCTHGVNRTGYLIVRYMIERLGYTPNKALKDFHLHRGHAIERANYIQNLKQRKPFKITLSDSEVAEKDNGKREVTSRNISATKNQACFKNNQSSPSVSTNNRFSFLSDAEVDSLYCDFEKL